MKRIAPILFLIATLLLVAVPDGAVRANSASQPFTTFLPLVLGAPKAGPPSGGGTPDPGSGDATWLPYTGADGTAVGTFGASLAVDVAGGVHSAYTTRIAFDGGRRPAYYAFCAEGCTDTRNWRRASLSDNAIDARLKLDSAGRPRMLLYVDADMDTATKEYQYAACDAGCTDTNNWTITSVLQVRDSPASHDDAINQYFALDPLGRPRFVYAGFPSLSETTPTYYVACDSDCSDTANWSQTEIAPSGWGLPALAFGPDGVAHLAVSGYLQSTGQNTLAYFECELACTSMSGVYIENVPNGGDYKLALDSQGRPRLALYTGVGGPAIGGAALPAGQVIYFFCDMSCTEPAVGHWMELPLDLPQYSGDKGIDLQIDQRDHPRLAYHVWPDGVGYTACDADCEQDSARWQAHVIETSSDHASYVEAPIRWCSISTWVTGKFPALAFDPQSRPLIVYNAEHGQGGQDRYGQACFQGADIFWVRFAALP